jgi:NTP pyrophosphatase (non-canonical NTP hydrolase)
MIREWTVWEKIWQGCEKYRESKGFLPCDWITAAARIACLYGEIYEVEVALRHWDKWMPSAGEEREVRFELADVVHYILGLQHDLGYSLGTQRTSYSQVTHRFASPAELTHPLRREWNQVFRAWKKGDEKNMGIALEILLAATLQLRANIFGADPEGEALRKDSEAKLESMKHRPELHGGRSPHT